MRTGPRDLEVSCAGISVNVAKRFLIDTDLFLSNSTLLDKPYKVQSVVSADVFILFISGLQGNVVDVEVTPANCTELERICAEFGFHDLDAAIAGCKQGDGMNEKLVKQVRCLEKKVEALEAEIYRLHGLESRISQLEGTKTVVHPVSVPVKTDNIVVERRPVQIKKGGVNLVVKRRSLLHYQEPKGKRSVHGYMGNAFDGIFGYLGRQYGDIVRRGIVSVTAESTWQSLSHIVELGSDEFYCSLDQPGQYITLDFKSGIVDLTGYMIRTDGRIEAWKMEVSMAPEGHDWKTIDTGDVLSVICKMKTLKSAVRCRCIRFSRVGRSSKNANILKCMAFEVFGRYTSDSVRIQRDFKADPLKDGIIAGLTEEYGNVYENGIVDITAKMSYEARNALELDDTWTRYNSENRHGQWLCADLKDRRAILTGYAIRSEKNGFKPPKSWMLEGSNDGEKWTAVDKQMNNDGLKKAEYQKQKEVLIPIKGCVTAFRLIRLQHIVNHSDDDTLIISGLELFGTLINP